MPALHETAPASSCFMWHASARQPLVMQCAVQSCKRANRLGAVCIYLYMSSLFPLYTTKALALRRAAHTALECQAVALYDWLVRVVTLHSFTLSLSGRRRQPASASGQLTLESS